jgi:hypothetical protein
MNTPLYDNHYLNVLSSVYYDNIRQIERLNQTNSEIQGILRSSLRENNNNNNTNRRNRRNHSNNSLENPNNRTSNNYSRPIHNARRHTPIRNTVLYNTLLNAFLEPVPTYPGTLQIEIATRNMLYGDIVSPRNTSCPISLERFENDDMVTTICHCGHIFMMAEIHHWFTTNCRCPVCRYDIREYVAGNDVPVNDISMNDISMNIRDTSTSRLNTDFSGNLIDTITDAILNELLNSTNDPSGNATFYFTFPTREQR